MDKTKYLIVNLVILLAASLCLNFHLAKACNQNKLDTVTVCRTDTFDSVRVDTLLHVYRTPIPVYTQVVDTLLIIRTDSNWIDTIRLYKEQKEYTDDSTYRAYVSGYEVSLDSITTFEYDYLKFQRIVMEKERTIQKLQSRWHIGPVVGVGLTDKGLGFMAGVGVCYRVF